MPSRIAKPAQAADLSRTPRLTEEQMADVRREARETFLYLDSKLVDGKPSPVTLHEHLFYDGNGQPYTAFIKATARVWKAFQDAGAQDLRPLESLIVLLVKGHSPTLEDRAAAKKAFTAKWQPGRGGMDSPT
jgi:hypothetical protein